VVEEGSGSLSSEGDPLCPSEQGEKKKKNKVILIKDPEGQFLPEKTVLSDGTAYRSPFFSDGQHLYLLTKLPTPLEPEEENKENEHSSYDPFRFSLKEALVSETRNETAPAAGSFLHEPRGIDVFQQSALPVDHRIYMGSIPRIYDNERVRELLVPFGEIRSLDLPHDETGKAGWLVLLI